MDSKLISQAQIRAGSKIHDVTGLMNAYGLWEALALRGDAAATVFVDQIECALRKFVATGAIEHVCDVLRPRQVHVPRDTNHRACPRSRRRRITTHSISS